MGKKKRQRTEKISMEEKLEIIAQELGNAAEWISDATPFEIISELARMGVSTHNWNDVKKFYDEWQPRKVDGEFIGAFEELSAQWRNEIKQKRRESIGISDDIFLMVAAEYYWEKYEEIGLEKAIFESEKEMSL